VFKITTRCEKFAQLKQQISSRRWDASASIFKFLDTDDEVKEKPGAPSW